MADIEAEIEDEVNEDVDFQNAEEEPAEDADLEDLSKIISYNVANTVEVLILKVDNNEIDMQPEFQREFVWDINRASLFIDSLLIGLPIPSIFLGKRKEDESYIVIDGQQRLKSAYYFMKGEFLSNGEMTPFILKNLKDREWNDSTYADLDATLQRRIRNAVLNTTIIEDIGKRPKVVHDIFHRLNTGGMPLTDQEIRNCVYSGVFNQQLIALNRNQHWRNLLGKQTPDRRLRDVELILRFLALRNNSDNFESPMREFLSNYQDVHQKIEDAASREILERTVHTILNEIGTDAFKIGSGVNKSVCDSVMVAVSRILDRGEIPDDMRARFHKLIVDEDYLKSVTYATSREENVRKRLDLAFAYLSN